MSLVFRIKRTAKFRARDFIAVEVFQFDTFPVGSEDDGAIQSPSDTISQGHLGRQRQKQVTEARNGRKGFLA